MKVPFEREQEIIANKFLKLPMIQKYEVIEKKKDGFLAEAELDDGYEFMLQVCVMEDAYPALVKDKIKSLPEMGERKNFIIVAPYVSEMTAKICEENGIGFFDYVGNCLFYNHSIYLCEKGNKNRQPKRRGQSSIFERSSEVSSLILRKLFQDVSLPWKLVHLAEQVGCSIGQISKVKDFLCKNTWAEMTNDGLRITRPEEILGEWARIYGKRESSFYSCYSLDGVVDFEKKLERMKLQTGIEYYLTGFSGGVRYAPVVRYNRVHVYMDLENIKDAMSFLPCKKVESGANVVILPIEEECRVKYAEKKAGYSVVSPIQIYLDCMQLKGRGEELAEVVMQKEILK